MKHDTPAVTVIDAIMGAGKTTWAFDKMNQAAVEAIFPDSDDAIRLDRPRFIYVTPFLKEIERAQDECPLLDFREPQDLDGRPKWVHFEWLLQEGHNIATTHALFPFLSERGIEAIRKHGYRLIIDEALDAFDIYDGLKASQMEWLLGIEAITIDPDDGQIHWVLGHRSMPKRGHRFEDVERMAQAGSLYRMDGKCVIWEFPKQALDAFSEITVLTYLFEASSLAPYLRANGFTYRVRGLDPKTGHLRERDTISEAYAKSKIRSRVRIYEGPKNLMGAYRPGSGRASQKFTKTHLDHALTDTDARRRISTTVTKYLERDARIPSSKVAWTTFKKHREKLKGRRYSSDDCFIPLNARASNGWQERQAMIYLANRYPNPMLKRYIEDKGESIDADLMALSEMLQWLWRGCIRVDGGSDMHVFVPSERMRGLLKAWLETDTLAQLYERLGGGYPGVPSSSKNPAIEEGYRPHP